MTFIMKHSSDKYQLVSELYTKIVGVLCIVAVFIAMFDGPLLAGVFLGIIVIPFAFYTKSMIKKDNEKVLALLDENHGACALMCNAYEPIANQNEKDKCIIFFRGKGITIDNITANQHIDFPKNRIKDINIYCLAEIKEISSTERYYTLGKLGEKFFADVSLQKNSKFDQNIQYVVIRTIETDKKINCASYLVPNQNKNFNRIASNGKKITEYCKENY